jgi:type II secretory pathway pseudopilin PulG
MMVVVAIIALLLAALLPAFSAVRGQAKIAQASAQFKALDTGINAFRAEAALGGSLPPSASDNSDQRQTIANPQNPPDTPPAVRVAGAHLLVHAMIGADGLGTPGFRDVNHDAKGLWSDDIHRKLDPAPGRSGIYALYQTGEQAGKEKFPRYGGAGYVDEKMKERVESLQNMLDEGKLLRPPSPDIALKEGMFMDPWDHPILYYKANATSLRMTGAQGKPGIFWQEDNGVITGSDGDIQKDDGLDFGQGTEGSCNGGKCYHNIAVAKVPDPPIQNYNPQTILTDTQYDHSFFRFILDASVKARATPVQKDTYLLISAGSDARYGTDDDVLNWTRKTD